MKGAISTFQADSCCSDGKLSNGAKFTWCLQFAFREIAANIVLFTVGMMVAMEMECLLLLFITRYYSLDTNTTFTRPKGVIVSNQNGHVCTLLELERKC